MDTIRKASVRHVNRLLDTAWVVIDQATDADYARGVAVGMISTLMATGAASFEAAIATVLDAVLNSTSEGNHEADCNAFIARMCDSWQMEAKVIMAGLLHAAAGKHACTQNGTRVLGC